MDTPIFYESCLVGCNQVIQFRSKPVCQALLLLVKIGIIYYLSEWALERLGFVLIMWYYAVVVQICVLDSVQLDQSRSAWHKTRLGSG
jgi:hypothetical protein